MYTLIRKSCSIVFDLLATSSAGGLCDLKLAVGSLLPVESRGRRALMRLIRISRCHWLRRSCQGRAWVVHASRQPPPRPHASQLPATSVAFGHVAGIWKQGCPSAGQMLFVRQSCP